MDVEIVTNVFRVMSLKQQVRKAILYWKETTQNSLERQETGKGREITQGLKYSLKFKEKKLEQQRGIMPSLYWDADKTHGKQNYCI